MKIQSLGYILVETENLSAWDHYGQEVCGFMKHPDFSDEEKLCLKIDYEPFRFIHWNCQAIPKGVLDVVQKK